MMKFRVYYDDTDAQGIVYHANYLRFCERARSEYIFRTLGKDAFNEQCYFVLTSINAKFRASARLGDEIEVRSVCAKNSDLAIVLQHEIDHFSGKLFYDYIDSKNPFPEVDNAIEI